MTTLPITHSFETIIEAYPLVVTVDSNCGAWDADGNEIELDDAVLDAAAPAADLAKAWKFLRQKRDSLMTETDWWVLPDRTATAEQLAYRQALRDLPANTVDPANPVWPTKPE